jgi:hypothetical protein
MAETHDRSKLDKSHALGRGDLLAYLPRRLVPGLSIPEMQAAFDTNAGATKMALSKAIDGLHDDQLIARRLN